MLLPSGTRDHDRVSAATPLRSEVAGVVTQFLHLRIASVRPDFTNHSGFPANTFARTVGRASQCRIPTAPFSSSGPEESPPGLEAIRAWLRKPRPRLRGALDWVRLLLSGLANAWDFTKKNARPGAAWIGRVAEAAKPAVQVAAKAGQGIRKIGVRASAAARAFRHPDGKRGETEAKIRKAGADAQRYGGRITALANLGETALSVLGGLAGMFQADRPTQFKLRESDEPGRRPGRCTRTGWATPPAATAEAPPRNHPR